MKKNDRKKTRNDHGREQKKESYHRADLKRRETRRQDDEGDDRFVIVGKNPVMEALRSEQQMDKLLILKDNKDHVLGDLAEKARLSLIHIYRATGNERLIQMINSLREQMQRVRVEYVHHIEAVSYTHLPPERRSPPCPPRRC